MIEGVQEVEGEMVGTVGNVTRVVKYEDGSFDFQKKSRIKRGGSSASDKTLDQLGIQYDLADVQTKVDAVLNKNETYLKRDFTTPQGRKTFLNGMRSQLQELSLEVAKTGKGQPWFKQNQQDILDIMDRGKESIGNKKMKRGTFYEIEKEKLVDRSLNDEIGHNELTIQLKFLETRYKLYPKYQDSEKEKENLLFDDFSIDKDGNIIGK